MLAFDIELASIFDLPPGGDLDDFAPFDLSVAAAYSDQGGDRVWHDVEDGRPAARMSAATARDLLGHLRECQLAGEEIVSWNGVGFDLRWIGHVADDSYLAGEIALDSFDPMLQFFNVRGFPIGLEAVATGLGMPLRKTMTGAEAPRAWAAARFDEVIAYVKNDCVITHQVVSAIARSHAIRWRTKKGDIKSEPLPRLLRAREVLRLPPPDQSWMSTPLPKEKFFNWIPQDLLRQEAGNST